QLLLESTDVIIWEYDLNADQFLYVSPQAERLNYPLERWFEPGFWQCLIHPADREWALAYCLAESRAGRNHRFQYRIHDADGNQLWVDDLATVAYADGGNLILRG